MDRQLYMFDVVAHQQEERKSRAEVFGDYDAFVDKFNIPKTTDDCYTPKEIYDEVKAWLGEQIDIEGRPIVRPFYPGGDFEHFAYPPNCIVLDNPPFSIYAKIVRFYKEQDIDFFLFAPAITQMVNNADVCYLCTMANVRYANKAVVRTSFTTSLFPGKRVWVCGTLTKRIEAVNDRLVKEGKKEVAKYYYPNNILTMALMGKVAARGVDFEIPADECMYVRGELDSLKAKGKGLFGGGLILSERAAAERAAAERAAALTLQLSEREKIIYREVLER